MPLAWVIVVLGVMLGGWLTFDGTRALVVGDYVTPGTGEYAGQLGPWAGLVSSIGIDPRSAFMKLIHVCLGLAWLVATIGFRRRASWAGRALMACAVLSLWYLPFGTLIGAIQIVLLMRPGVRRRA